MTLKENAFAHYLLYTHDHRAHFLRDFGRVSVASLAGIIVGGLLGRFWPNGFSGAITGVLLLVLFRFLSRVLLLPALLPCSSTDNAAKQFDTRISGPFQHSGITTLFGFSVPCRPCHALYARWFDSGTGLGFSLSLGGGRHCELSTVAYERWYFGCLPAFPALRQRILARHQRLGHRNSWVRGNPCKVISY